ncbi:DUF2796 domain-containing protein [Pseudomonas sp. NBRC 100443]|uniref:DUF2796 domain-containing protein n=1 Tax=Pseudomonas sp. NBRC 100443 TaxID=1113665 RepID=UPI0024A533F8|nr:DUF2796 domain-containing protein [Pseudomonas sp. NBRC 100443]GLU41984.1 hypothetical protein Pssp01_60770 [Pseudomonas sp. NBRC 100443]
MRPLLLALALIPFAAAQAHDEHEHGSLGKHEHGVAQLNVALDGNTLELEVDSPAMNFVGFEHPASSAADQATVAAARAQLGKPLELVQAPAAAKCGVAEVELESPLFGNAKTHEHDHDDDHDHDGDEHEGHQHSDINAHYKLTCAAPEALASLDFAPLFKRFPGTQKLVVQLIGPNGQQGAELTPASSLLKF